MKLAFYPRLAFGGMRKNGRLYLPYIGACILMAAVFYIMHFLGFSHMLEGFTGAGTARDMLRLGTVVMAIFGTIFLFYTQSALIKGRLREFGLYSVLGMNRRNLGILIFFETAITWLIAVAGGLAAGIGFSKLAEFAFRKMVGAGAGYRFTVHLPSVYATVVVYGVIFLLIFLNAVRQVGFSRAIQLVNAEKAGEKPPKSNWFVGILGLVILLAGYIVALRISQPVSALLVFFGAVVLIIIGTYLVLIAGSVLLCRILQKNKSYYYRPDHFVSVSSMTYRMKRNGAGLASICILLTMILVMVSSSSALYFNCDGTLRNTYPGQLNCSAMNYGYDAEYDEIAARMQADLLERTEEFGAEADHVISVSGCSLAGYFEDGRLRTDMDPMSDITAIDYDKVAQVYFYDADTYNRLTGSREVLSAGEALVGVQGRLDFGDELGIGGETFRVAGRFDPRAGDFRYAAGSSVVSTLFVVVDDLDTVGALFNGYTDARGRQMLTWEWHCYFDTDLDEAGQNELSDDLHGRMGDELYPRDFFGVRCVSRAYERTEYLAMFGGLFYLGILLSVVFLVSCVLIIYYKQISEGFEDRARFGIMQKIGMTGGDIRKSVNSQMLTVFLIPIVFACVHLAVVLPFINKILMLFGHNDLPRLLISAGVCALICGIFYAAIYKLTSNAYYRIVA
ncbi:MAG: ABC transporter permease [Lachnospiraceae bacterium]|nr:ABC transporter permease [Lachnospiraceae bacterium]